MKKPYPLKPCAYQAEIHTHVRIVAGNGKEICHNILFLLALCICCASTANFIRMQPAVAAEGVQSSEYTIGVADVLGISVRNHDDLNSTFTVRPDGKISVPRAGEIQAAGLTAPALAANIQAKLSKWLNHAYVTVTVNEVHSQRARIVGAVKSPGAYDLKPKWRVMDLAAVAGGLSVKPVYISGRVIRNGEILPFSVEQAYLDPQSKANIELEPEDLVILDQQNISKQIQVVGQVANPGAFDLDEGLTVINLLAQAGDATAEAALSKAYVLRGSQQIAINLQSILAGGKPDEQMAAFKLQAGDVLVIPTNTERFAVMGEVTKAGYYPFSDGITAVRALATAGGRLADGDLRHVTMTRTINGKTTVTTLNIQAMLDGTAQDEVLLQPGDLLHVPILQNQVHVIGEVEKPGAYTLTDDLNLISLVAEAGSPVADANLSKAYVLRDTHQLPVDLQKVLVEGEPAPAVTGFRLEHGDILVIPQNQKRFGVMGQVGKPGYYPFPDKMADATVLKALATAGGASSEANLKEASILRMVDGNAVRIPVDLRDILGKGDLESNVVLKPEDILYVPPKGKSSWDRLLSPLLILGGAIF
jgi:protein involved in polysaccharide export with SLBB domain